MLEKKDRGASKDRIFRGWDKQMERLGVDIKCEIQRRIADEGTQENWERIENSKYNKWCKSLKQTKVRTEYLGVVWMSGKEKQRLARYRVGNEMRSSAHWKGCKKEI